ncbi:MAG: ATP-dependent zinc metalloprotease FtsH [Acidimicrobiaceae bacterium]|nr:ATP-dependent zinc metalloprotease FtsH [Acidimicrobiaceae bacterium]MCY4281200.1 ATP-dependent zinc metalloprotease FtsH [Acidimicrobiaceae bacterium]MCY4294062.1 ATP-dependent zinc metalloprotease FtsH [Acidimicrobiaceae bacterium]
MADSAPPPPPPPSPAGGARGSRLGRDSSGSPDSANPSEAPRRSRLIIWVMISAIIAIFVATTVLPDEDGDEISYPDFLERVSQGGIVEGAYNNNSGSIKATAVDGAEYKSNGPLPLPDTDTALINDNVAEFRYETPTTNFFLSLLPLLLPIGLLILFFWWMQRRAQGQVGSIMSIGRSRAKTYSTERPGTTFEDVAGYDGVKQEITEIVDFLKTPERFSQIGARVPKGVLLVGPPGTGKTLIAKAVAGEAGVPFLSVTGSDFMEMFVGVGASRVRDLFESARKMGKAIIFIDEVDSIGRKRGAGLGGGHDEREQTLNQMLSEMDGFEGSEGIVMMAATNRPDILDPALLRPGRFDRQVVVPLPELTDRHDILKVHIKGKLTADDLDLNVVARGTPGMSGADLANLINEAALYAVRSGDDEIAARHVEMARDRVLMGQKRESLALSNEEKEAIAYHEAGHAVCASVLPTADPLHKVTIIPSGMALGVTMQLPEEDRHIYRSDYILDRLVVMFGGRIAEELVFGIVSTGAADDLMRATALARSMVREWGMSTELGPMAWGSQNQVFLGEDLVQTRDYSDDTARVIDQETERILREQQDRCRLTLNDYRHGLDLVARALLEHETISGEEVDRLIAVSRNGSQAAGSLAGEAAGSVSTSTS